MTGITNDMMDKLAMHGFTVEVQYEAYRDEIVNIEYRGKEFTRFANMNTIKKLAHNMESFIKISDHLTYPVQSRDSFCMEGLYGRHAVYVPQYDYEYKIRFRSDMIMPTLPDKLYLSIGISGMLELPVEQPFFDGMTPFLKLMHPDIKTFFNNVYQTGGFELLKALNGILIDYGDNVYTEGDSSGNTEVKEDSLLVTSTLVKWKNRPILVVFFPSIMIHADFAHTLTSGLGIPHDILFGDTCTIEPYLVYDEHGLCDLSKDMQDLKIKLDLLLDL